MLEKTGLIKEDILDSVGLVVETLGECGSILMTKNEEFIKRYNENYGGI